MSEIKPFWIDEHTRTFEKLEECEPKSSAFIQAVEYAALESANEKIIAQAAQIAELTERERLMWNQAHIMNTKIESLEAEVERLEKLEES